MLRKAPLRTIRLRLGTSVTRSGSLELGWLRFRCAIGQNGVTASKREGDGATPAGTWKLDEVLWRSDRNLGRRVACALPARAIRPDQGWCDAPADRNYNRAIRHPYPARAECLWREDHLYDIVVVLGYNRRPRLRGRGSAIFLHVARPDYAPTEGCIALRERDLRLLLSRVGRRSQIAIGRQF
jgi:L,D-peptidoglycan transpeptidase YkuD (ErfK/YbiS/YcfS/YnhG family)